MKSGGRSFLFSALITLFIMFESLSQYTCADSFIGKSYSIVFNNKINSF